MSRDVDYFRRVSNLLAEVSQIDTNLDDVEQFFSNGLNVNVQVNGSPLHFALGGLHKQNRLALVQKLVEHGADLNIPDNCHTPLHRACRNHLIELEVIRHLVESGAPINARDIDNRTPLFWAVAFQDMEVVEYLCQMGADWDAQDADNFSPIHWACMKGKVQMVKYFLLQKAQLRPSIRNQLPLDLLPPHAAREVAAFTSLALGRTQFMDDRNQIWTNTNALHQSGLQLVGFLGTQRNDMLHTLIVGNGFRADMVTRRKRISDNDTRQLSLLEDHTFSRNAMFNVAVQEDSVVLCRKQLVMLREKYESPFMTMRADLENQRKEAVDSVIRDSLVAAWDDCEVNRPEAGHYGDIRFHRVTTPWRGMETFDVVVKKMNPERFPYAKMGDYLKTLLELDHPNIINLYGVRAPSPEEFYILEEGFTTTLKDYLSDESTNIFSDLKILMAIARGLQYLHRMQLAHGNLKIHNVLIRGKGRDRQAILCDFYYRDDVLDPEYNNSLQVFRAPEQILKNSAVTAVQLDMYAFGILSYCVIMKKKEEDLYHRLRRPAEELDQFVHQNGIRPLLNWFPPELGLEISQEFRSHTPRIFDELKQAHAACQGKKKDVNKKIADLCAERFTLYPANSRDLKGIVSAVQGAYGRCFGGGGLFRRKKTGDTEQQFAQFEPEWRQIFEDYLNRSLLPEFQRFFMDKLEDLPSISRHDVAEFQKKLRDLIPGCAQPLLEYFEVLWVDMCYVKEYIKKTPQEFMDLMCRCWDPTPANRWPSFEALEEALDEILQRQIASLKRMSPEEIAKFRQEAQMEEESIEQQYVALATREEESYIAQDEQHVEVRAILGERADRVKVLTKINDEIAKLMKARQQLESELARANQTKQAATRRKNELLEGRNALSAERVQMNEREKNLGQRIRDVFEQETLLREQDIDW